MNDRMFFRNVSRTKSVQYMGGSRDEHTKREASIQFPH